MLGSHLVEIFQKQYEVFGSGNSDFENNKCYNYKVFDLTRKSFEKLKSWVIPDIIIHCGAITNLEFCQKRPKHAMEVNAYAVKKLLDTYPTAKFILISSDAVFPERDFSAKENSTTDPLNTYGLTKEMAENFISKDKHLIIRTTIVGLNINKGKKSLVDWILQSLQQNKVINLFEDVIFTPITIWDLGSQIRNLIEVNVSGLFHIAGKNPISKFEFGIELCRELNFNERNIIKSKIEKTYSTVRRPKNQTLDSSFYEKTFNVSLPSIEKTIRTISSKYLELSSEKF